VFPVRYDWIHIYVVQEEFSPYRVAGKVGEAIYQMSFLASQGKRRSSIIKSNQGTTVTQKGVDAFF
jgi:hypothetical protein